MTPFGRLLRRAVERLLDRWQEGPEAPARLHEMSIAYAEMYPHATRGQWVAFATQHAAEAYRSGFVRGVEHVERDPDPFPVRPEQVADHLTPGWRDSIPLRIGDPGDIVPDVVDERKMMDDQVRQLLRRRGR